MPRRTRREKNPSRLRIRQRRRRFGYRPEDARESPALQQLASFAAAAGDLVLRRADRLLAAARGFDGQQVTVARRGDEAEHAIIVGETDQEDAFSGT